MAGRPCECPRAVAGFRERTLSLPADTGVHVGKELEREMSVLIETNGLGRNFGSLQAVRGVSFQVHAGDVLGFLGPNGAGKSTTMKMLSCFLEPSFGSAKVAGYDIVEQSIEVRRRLGYLPENAPLYAEMRVGEFLAFVAEVRAIEAGKRKAAIDSAVERTSLASVFDQRIETLSKGFRRRVGLAQALIHSPEILILDEPTDGLDPNQKHEVRELIRNMSDTCIILSTHILEEVDAVCNRAIILANGSIVADDTPEGLRARAALGGQVSLKVSASAKEQVVSFLQSLPAVATVSAAEASDFALVRGALKPGQRLESDELLHQALAQGWQLSEFSQGENGLDAVFREITQSAVAQ